MANRVGGTYLQTGVLRPINFIEATRNPTTTDINASLGDEWLNTLTGDLWYLSSLQNFVGSGQVGAYAKWLQFFTMTGPNLFVPGNLTVGGSINAVGGIATLSNLSAVGTLNVTGVTTLGTIFANIMTITTATVTGNFIAGTVSTGVLDANILNLPTTTATAGQITINGIPFLSNYGPIGSNNNTFLGANAGNFTLISTRNTGLGYVALSDLTTGGQNTAVGYASLPALTTGQTNTALGVNSGLSLLTGIANTLIGTGAGYLYTGAEGQNTILGSNIAGVEGESGVMRLGNVDNTVKTYIAGINDAVTTAFAEVMVIDDVTQQVTTITNNLIGYVLTSTGTVTTPTWQPPAPVTGGAIGQVLTSAGIATPAVFQNPSMLGLSAPIIAVSSLTLVYNNIYITVNGTGTINLTLPLTAPLGSVIIILGFGSASAPGLYSIRQNAGQNILSPQGASTTGTGGSYTATNNFQSITLYNFNAGPSSQWIVMSYTGTWTIV